MLKVAVHYAAGIATLLISVITNMSDTKRKSSKRSRPKQKLPQIIVSIILISVAVFLLVSQREILNKSLRVLADVKIDMLLVAVTASLLTFLLAACIYQALALTKLKYSRTVLVELAASFANRLLPAGLGGLGLHGIYLHKQRHTAAEATAIVSVNNLLGIIAHLSLLIVVCVLQPGLIGTFAKRWAHIPWGALLIVAVVIVVLISCLPMVRSGLRRFLNQLGISLRRLTMPQLFLAYVLALLLTLTYTATLYMSAHALGITLSPLKIFIVFSIGMLAGTATPTPGGLVGIEAGLYAGLISYGARTAPAAATVLLYRLLTYWGPLLPGMLALLLCRRRKFV